ncbi:MAG: autotransporter outer membrane beta-barrel domain-containing protein [Pseudomonadota bacterium]
MKSYPLRKLRFGVAFGALALSAALATTPAAAQEVVSAIIDNGTIQLGVNQFGTLITPGSNIGLIYIPTGGDALAPGCACEGWGIADLDAPDFSFGRSQDNGNTGPGSAELTFSGVGTLGNSVGDSAKSVTNIHFGESSWAQVVHDFHPSASANLFQVDVSILNTGGTSIGNLVYRRVMDWDIFPTEFSEIVTLQGWPAKNLIHSSDDGFADPNPTVPLTGIMDGTVDQNFQDLGPDDHGAALDFSFGALAAGASRDFKIFYGAAATQEEALEALAEVNAEVYSLGMPSGDGSEETVAKSAKAAAGDVAAAADVPESTLEGTPNTFIFAFAGVGGVPVGGMIPVSVDTISTVRQLNTFAIRRNMDFVGMRTDGLTGGGDRRMAGGVGDQTAKDGGLAIFASVGYGEGWFQTTPTDESDFHVGHFNFGADYTFAPPHKHIDNVRIGMGFGVSDASATYRFDPTTLMETKADSRWSPSVAVYGGARIFERGYVDATLALGDFDYDVSRRMSDAMFRGKAHSKQLGLSVRGGYDFATTIGDPVEGQAATFGPYASIEYLDGEFEGYTETSADRPNNAIIFPGADYSNWITQLGGRVSVVTKAWSMPISLSGKLLWEHQFEADSKAKVVASVGGLASLAPYGVEKDDYARIAFRAAMPVGNGALVALDLGGTLGGDSSEGTAALQFRMKF